MSQDSSSAIMPADRQEKIAALVTENGSARVNDLSLLFNVAEITIRRDLALLEERGLVERTHGGAISARRLKTEPLYNQKSERGREEKAAIGRAVAAMLDDGETVLVNSGSTTLEVIRAVERPGVRIITTNADALRIPSRPGVELILTGGEFRAQSNSLIGPFAQATLGRIIGTTAVIGVDGLSCRYGLTTPNQYEAEIARLMVERTRGRVIVVADHGKVGVISNFLSVAVEEADIVVCDDGLDDEYRRELEEHGLQVHLVRADNR